MIQERFDSQEGFFIIQERNGDREMQKCEIAYYLLGGSVVSKKNFLMKNKK